MGGLFVGVLGACVQPPRAPPAVAVPAVPAGFPVHRYEAGYGPRGRVFRLDPARSVVTVHAHRGGRLARLGHNHVVASREVRGYLFLADTFAASAADLYIPLAGLIVDDPGDRIAAGSAFASNVSAEAVGRTRDNMLSEAVLDAARHPFAVVHATIASATPPAVFLAMELEIRGIRRSYQLPARLVVGADAITVSGAFEFKQSDFGIRPFTTLGGALTVEDTVSVTYRLYAVPRN